MYGTRDGRKYLYESDAVIVYIVYHEQNDLGGT